MNIQIGMSRIESNYSKNNLNNILAKLENHIAYTYLKQDRNTRTRVICKKKKKTCLKKIYYF